MRVAKGGRTLAGLGAGDWFGEIALVTGAPRTATVTATSPVRVLVLDDRSSRRAVAEMPSIALKVMASLGERLAADARGPSCSRDVRRLSARPLPLEPIPVGAPRSRGARR